MQFIFIPSCLVRFEVMFSQVWLFKGEGRGIRGYPGSPVPGLCFQVLSGGGGGVVSLVSGPRSLRGADTLVSGSSPPFPSPRQDQDRDTPSPTPSRTITGVPLASPRQDQDRGTPPHPTPAPLPLLPQQDTPWKGYSASGMPLVFSRRRTLL